MERLHLFQGRSILKYNWNKQEESILYFGDTLNNPKPSITMAIIHGTVIFTNKENIVIFTIYKKKLMVFLSLKNQTRFF